jgi:hypothetical protein
MSTPYFVNWEGSSITWDIFNQSHIGIGIKLFDQKRYKDALTHFEAALTFPENLGVGKSSRTEEAEAWFWKGKTLIALEKPLPLTTARLHYVRRNFSEGAGSYGMRVSDLYAFTSFSSSSRSTEL